jgi:hypothetical protein
MTVTEVLLSRYRSSSTLPLQWPKRFSHFRRCIKSRILFQKMFTGFQRIVPIIFSVFRLPFEYNRLSVSHTVTTSLRRTRSWSRTKNPARVKGLGRTTQHILACRLHLCVKNGSRKRNRTLIIRVTTEGNTIIRSENENVGDLRTCTPVLD